MELDIEIGRKLTEAGVPFFVCQFCSTINVNPKRERYCGRCHRFVDDPQPDSEGKHRVEPT